MYPRAEENRVTLLDALDKVIETGAVVCGDLTVRVADIDLIYIGLRLVATSVSRLEKSHPVDTASDRPPTPAELDYLRQLEAEIERAEKNISSMIQISQPKQAEQGLAKLVLTLVILIKRLMEREVFRRIQSGALAAVEMQKLGLTFLALDKKVEELKLVFGLQNEELNLELGPLGNLM